MSLIKLTNQNGKTIYIEPDDISIVDSGFDETKATTIITNKDRVFVQESPEEVISRIEKAYYIPK